MAFAFLNPPASFFSSIPSSNSSNSSSTMSTFTPSFVGALAGSTLTGARGEKIVTGSQITFNFQFGVSSYVSLNPANVRINLPTTATSTVDQIVVINLIEGVDGSAYNSGTFFTDFNVPGYTIIQLPGVIKVGSSFIELKVINTVLQTDDFWMGQITYI